MDFVDASIARGRANSRAFKWPICVASRAFSWLLLYLFFFTYSGYLKNSTSLEEVSDLKEKDS